MPRVGRGVTARARYKEVTSVAKGFHGRCNNVYRITRQMVMHVGQCAYRDRCNKRRVFRAFWIIRINAGVREYDLTYGKFMNGLKEAPIGLNHKVLSDMAIHDKVVFAVIMNQVKANVA